MSETFREPFVIEVTELSGGTFLILVSGEMDVATSPELISTMSSLQGPASYQVVVDLSALSFIDSTGIRALVSSAKIVETQGGRLVVVAPTAKANIRRVFDIVQLSEMLPIVESVDEAISHSGQGHGGGSETRGLR